MCRSIKTLRPPYTEGVTEEDVRAAALQYVRKVGGVQTLSPATAEAVAKAVDLVAAVSGVVAAASEAATRKGRGGR